MSVTPTIPQDEVDEETHRILLERDATFEDDKESAQPWSEVKSEILVALRTPQPH